MLKPFRWLAITTIAVCCSQVSWAQSQTLTVSKPTSLDWTFVVSNQSLTEVPGNWLPSDYDSAKQRYELALPKRYTQEKPSPLILFISPSSQPAALRQWAAVCQNAGFLLASPYDAGNGVATPQRVRVVADVLSDLRGKYNIDVDRTYIGGFSGGGRIACAIAFALPEYFGGVIPVCAGGDLRQESWLRQRVIDRLSVAQLTGSTDFNRGEVERLHQTELSSVGVRCKTWVAARLGHSIPSSRTLTASLKWLEADLPRRRELAEAWPASSASTDVLREIAAADLLAEAEKRINDPGTLYSGLMQLKGLRVRWGDQPAAQKALETLEQFAQEPKRDWEDQDIEEQRRFLIARARGLDSYGSGTLPKQYESQRASIISAAISHWQRVVDDGADSEVAREGAARITRLRKLSSE